jgi:hypothetical protein
MKKPRGISDAEWELVTTFREGRAVIANCNFGLGIEIEEDERGRGRIRVSQMPIRPGYDGKALRSFMAETVTSWSNALHATSAVH